MVKLEEVVRVSDVVELEVEEGVEATEMEKDNTGSVSSKGLGAGYAFLDAIEEDKRDEEVEKKREENRKRKSDESDRMLRVKGLKVGRRELRRVGKILFGAGQWREKRMGK